MSVMKHYAIIFGGQSTEHDASRKGFEYLYQRLIEHPLKGYSLELIVYITHDGKCLLRAPDFTKDTAYYESSDDQFEIGDAFKILKDKDLFVYSILHGQNGEDGGIQGMAQFLKIRGSFGGLLSCSLGMSKYHLNQYVKGNFKNISIPETACLRKGDNILQKIHLFKNREIVVKPNSLGASIMTEKLIVNDATEKYIVNLIDTIFVYDTRVLIQEYINGNEYSCGCLECNKDIEILPLVKIITRDHFFGHKEKHRAGYSEEILIPVKDETPFLQLLKHISRDLYIELDFQNAVRFDFIIANDLIYFLEANPLPGIMKNSILPKMLRARGLNVENLIEICFENEVNRVSTKTDLSYYID